jgi:ATP-dependent exoDNAse (exonuclease V) alpha subunit
LAGHRLTALGVGGVTCETIHRFKGLEADAVILILDTLETERDLMLAYVGLSRAKSVLAVVAETDELEQLQVAKAN